MAAPPFKQSISPERLRERLTGQLEHLIDEIDFLRTIADRIPVRVQEDRPHGDDLSIKETYGYLAAADEQVWLPLLHQLVADDEPSATIPASADLVARGRWNEMPLADIFARVQEARRSLVDFLNALPPAEWERTARVQLRGDEEQTSEHAWTVYHLAHHVTQDTADLLRTIGYRLHETHLTDRQEDLPK